MTRVKRTRDTDAHAEAIARETRRNIAILAGSRQLARYDAFDASGFARTYIARRDYIRNAKSFRRSCAISRRVFYICCAPPLVTRITAYGLAVSSNSKTALYRVTSFNRDRNVRASVYDDAFDISAHFFSLFFKRERETRYDRRI